MKYKMSFIRSEKEPFLHYCEKAANCLLTIRNIFTIFCSNPFSSRLYKDSSVFKVSSFKAWRREAQVQNTKQNHSHTEPSKVL